MCGGDPTKRPTKSLLFPFTLSYIERNKKALKG